MRLYEFEGKQLFAEAGIAIPQGEVVTSVEEASKVASQLGYPVVLKVQVLTGGRGKSGGIQFADNEEQLRAKADELFKLKIKGYPVERLLIEKKLNIAGEYYLGVTIDRVNYQWTVIGSASGGVDIEEVAAKSPDKIVRINIDPDSPIYSFEGNQLGNKMGLSGDAMKSVSSIARKLFKVFRSWDCKMVEINPLVQLDDGSFIAADSRISVDDDALFRHPQLEERGIEKRHEEGEMTPRERQAKEWGIPYLDLDGNIGMFPGGAGFGIMGNDFIYHYGGKPANFMDSGGGPSPERLAKMLVLLDENPNVKVIFGARFGGISRCDDFAKGVIMFLKDHGLSKPMVMRFTGNEWKEGVRIFEEEKKASPELFERIEIHGIETPIEEISKRAVELAGEVG
ncbi:succinate--CoA ligase subunit beta [candidate division LCP-89 bacterium B3_LCP]|uniref:Succinate--CoA ligase subunit beta n=1 Tax=candidate division LCP-89 bacterium B3_LCP TaxID=2012998 RepID=A0A532V0I4_UNCL8|nr:MAG: succinate--CoA ligase subunit beta [candidate division LCP-89 bacterium B3_LCP]